MSNLARMSESLTAGAVPRVEAMSSQLTRETGWSLEIVPGLIPVTDFFRLLADRKFCTSTWVRKPEQLDYTEEPDMFHDSFGHVPPLMDPDFARFMHLFGEVGVALEAREDSVLALQRLYWYFVEFGFILYKGEPRIIGAGIASSYGETEHSWSLRGQLEPFDLLTVMATPFRTDVIQTRYFVVEDINALVRSLELWVAAELA